MPLSCIDTSSDVIDNCPIGVETGIEETLFYAADHDLVKSPRPKARTSSTTAENWLTLDGNFEFKPGKSISSYSCTESPAYNDDLDGDTGSKGIKATLKAMFQRTPQALGVRAKIKNGKGIVIFRDGEGRWCMLGFKGRSAKLKTAKGELSAGKASQEFEWESPVEAYYLPDNFDPLNLTPAVTPP